VEAAVAVLVRAAKGPREVAALVAARSVVLVEGALVARDKEVGRASWQEMFVVACWVVGSELEHWELVGAVAVAKVAVE